MIGELHNLSLKVTPCCLLYQMILFHEFTSFHFIHNAEKELGVLYIPSFFTSHGERKLPSHLLLLVGTAQNRGSLVVDPHLYITQGEMRLFSSSMLGLAPALLLLLRGGQQGVLAIPGGGLLWSSLHMTASQGERLSWSRTGGWGRGAGEKRKARRLCYCNCQAL